MRYIDADKLKEELKHSGYCNNNWLDIEMYINNQPTADVRENVKGQWLDYRDNPIKFYFDGRYSAHCSVCGYHPEYEEEMRSANFCPNCGADMRPISALSENVEIVSNLKRGES